MNKHPKRSLFTLVGTHSLPSSNDDDDLSSSSPCSSTGSSGFNRHFGFLGRSLTHKPSVQSLLHSTPALPVHVSSQSLSTLLLMQLWQPSNHLVLCAACYESAKIAI